MKEDTFCTFILFLERGTMLGPACRFGKKNNLLKNTKNINIFDNYNFIGGGGGSLVVLFRLSFFV